MFKYTKHGNKKFTIAAYCVFKYTKVNYHDTQKLCIFLQILNIASILDNYVTYFPKKNKIIPIAQVF